MTCLFLRQLPPTVTDVPTTNPEFLVSLPPMAEESCAPYGAYAYLPEFGNLTECVPLNRCGKILDNHNAPNNQTQPCGFDTESEMMMICCPPELITEPQLELRQKPRFPRPDGKPRPVEDKTELCGRWKDNDGCALDHHFQISEADKGNGKIENRNFFDFMQITCMDSCGWAEKSGCVDEHPRCGDWSRSGFCNTNPFFLAHTCRESCGVCGFLSSYNNEEQVVGGNSYSDYKSENFKCGNYKLLCEINNESCEGRRYRVPEEEEEEEATVTREDEETNKNVIRDEEDYFDREDLDVRTARDLTEVYL